MIKISEGNFLHTGVLATKDAACFTLEAEKEQECFLLLYDKKSRELTERIEIPRDYSIGSLRSVYVEGIDCAKSMYLYEIDGTQVLDAYAQSIIGREVWRDKARLSDGGRIFAGIIPHEKLWKDDKFPELSCDEMVMYKLHVRGFTMDQAKVRHKGTFEALEEKIPYLKELGVTTVEVMPIYEFEEWMLPEDMPEHISWEEAEGDIIRPLENDEFPKVNFWGYTKGNYMAPKASYAHGSDPSEELRHLIHTLHENNMEIVMEMFFTGYMNPQMIVSILRHWVVEYHVDGFSLMGDNLPLDAIAEDKILGRSKLFCGGFDSSTLDRSRMGNLYIRNDDFMYASRKLLNRMEGRVFELAAQMRRQGNGFSFVNYIATNNGFTLADIFSYSEKHNEANGEDNSDGPIWNYSTGCGAEGPTRKKSVNEFRLRQIRNAMCVCMLSQAVPLIMAGDEFGNSQDGNNNAYCQDNKTGWINWQKSKSNAKLLAFFKDLSAFRKEHPVLRSPEPYQFCDYKRVGFPDLSYHCEQPWVNEIPASRYAVGILYNGLYTKKPSGEHDDILYICYNFHMGMQLMSLPAPVRGGRWEKLLSTCEGEGVFLKKPELFEDQKLLMIPGQSVIILRLLLPKKSEDDE